MAKIGFDFGTTYSMISHIIDGELRAFEPAQNANASIPSLVVAENGVLQYATRAKAILGRSGSVAYEGFKMLLAEDNEQILSEYGFDHDTSPLIITRKYIDYIVNLYLQRTRQEQIQKMVVCVPANWYMYSKLIQCRKKLYDLLTNNEKIQSVKLISEPEAACAYFCENYRKTHGKYYEGHILIVDYGGGTLDIALCDIQLNHDGTLNEIKVLHQIGAGENHGEQPGQAGLAFCREVVRIALREGGASDEVLANSASFAQAVSRFEVSLMGGASEIEEVFGMLHDSQYSTKLGDLSNKLHCFTDFEMEKNIYVVTYSMLAKAYDNIIRTVLKEKIEEMQTYMQDHLGIQRPGTAKDKIKIACVGGFCNFFLTEQQIHQLFRRGGDNDTRFEGIIIDKSDCEKAVSYGAALEANDLVKIIPTAPCSIGIANTDGSEMHFAFKKGEEIEYDKPVFIANGIPFKGRHIPNIAYNFFEEPSKADIRTPPDKYRERLLLNDTAWYVLAFSVNESKILQLHKYIVDDPYNPEEHRDHQIVDLDDFWELVGGFVTRGDSKNV